MYNSYVYALYSKLFQLLCVIYIQIQNILKSLLLPPKTNFIIHKYCKFRKLILPGDLEYIFRSNFIYVF